MSSEWELVELGQVVERINTGLDAIRRAPIIDYETKLRCLRIQDITNAKPYEKWGFTDVSDSDLIAYRLRVGEIIMARTCSPGANYLVRQDLNAVFNNGLARLRPLVEQANSKYLYYVFQCSDFINYIYGISGGTSVQLNMKVGDLARYSFLLPPVKEQKAIAYILGTLDDKIELNRKTNETLEAMAKALFKSWFADFDPVRAKAEGRSTGLPADISDLFPDSFEDSELGEIPSGWNIRTVEEIAEKVAMGPFGSNIKVSTFVDRGIPVISGQHLKGAILHDGGNNFITPDHADKLKNSCVRRGDIVFTHAGSIGQVSLIPVNSEHQKYVLSQRQFYLRPSSNNLSHYLTMFFRSTNGQHVLLSNASQTGVPSIARPASFLRSIQMLIPRTELLDAYDRQISAMFTKARSITEQNLALLDIRDALLSRLISGEIRIPDAEKMLEEVGI